MVIYLVAYSADEAIGRKQFEWTGVRNAKKQVKGMGVLADCFDLFFGAFPSTIVSRVRRVDGRLRWKGLEIAAREVAICPRS
jgi:hypothetical protein